MSLQVSIALISFLETMLLIYLSYKVRAQPGVDFSCSGLSEPAASREGVCLGDVSAGSECFPLSFSPGLLDERCAEQNLLFPCFLRNSDLFKAGSPVLVSG